MSIAKKIAAFNAKARDNQNKAQMIALKIAIIKAKAAENELNELTATLSHLEDATGTKVTDAEANKAMKDDAAIN